VYLCTKSMQEIIDPRGWELPSGDREMFEQMGFVTTNGMVRGDFRAWAPLTLPDVDMNLGVPNKRWTVDDAVRYMLQVNTIRPRIVELLEARTPFDAALTYFERKSLVANGYTVTHTNYQCLVTPPTFPHSSCTPSPVDSQANSQVPPA